MRPTRYRFPLRGSALPRLALLAGLVLGPGAAGAMPIATRYDGVLAVFSSLAPPVFFTGSGSISVDATPSGHLQGLVLASGGVATTTSLVSGTQELRVQARNGIGVFSAGGGFAGGFGGSMPILGSLRFCALGTCDASPVVDLRIPLTPVGVGGTVATTTPGGAQLSIVGAPWGTGMLTLTGPGFSSLFSGYRVGPASLPSSTALSGGFLSLVTPVHVQPSGVPGLPGIDLVLLFDVSLVPEPGAAALVALGLAALAAAAGAGGRARAH